MPFLGTAVTPPPTIHVFLCHHMCELNILEWFCPVPPVIRRVAADSAAMDSISSWVGGMRGKARPPLGRVDVGVFVVQIPQELPVYDCVFLLSFIST